MSSENLTIDQIEHFSARVVDQYHTMFHENILLKRAIRFYGDKKNYIMVADPVTTNMSCRINQDGGAMAREVIGELEAV